MTFRCILFKFILHLCLIVHTIDGSHESEFCEIPENPTKIAGNCAKDKYLSNKRYILYDVNPMEGFNLRRDVFIRTAVFVHHLAELDWKYYNWFLVLPPWEHLYHWRSRDVGKQTRIPWSLFFDIESLEKFAPVIEMSKFLQEYESENGVTTIDRVYILQNDPTMFETGDFRDRNEVAECINNRNPYKKKSDEKFYGNFWGYENITARQVECVTFHGTMSHLTQNLEPDLDKSYMFDHMEIPLHDFYGSQDYWKARRSMRYNSKLYKIASKFREKYLNSTDKRDKTERPVDWLQEKEQREAVGGPYLSVHLRRRDFLTGRSESVPTIKNAASQLASKMKELGVKTAFIATDADNQDFNELKDYLPGFNILKYIPTHDVKEKFKDGGVAIIDQIICSHARYFIGTHESTFTFRIQEDREILGFPTKTTFNRLCGNGEDCPSGSKWEIVW